MTALGLNKGRLLRMGWMMALLTASGTVCARYDGPEVEAFVAEMTRDHGFAGEQLIELFDQAKRQQSILDAISRPAERVKAWKEYRPIFLTDSRIGQGVDFWRQHEAALARAEQSFGVPAQFIVAIIGIETFYGRNTGNYRVLDALATLGFDYPPRQPFFRQQLKEFLLLAREEQVDPLALKGSYAGAMGLPQFMPSSFRAFAVDFDQDGHVDIWNNPTDAIGSVANYFKQHGWRTGEPVAVRVERQGTRFEEGLTQGLEPSLTLPQLQALGWQPRQRIADNQRLLAFRLEGEKGDEFWLGLANFQTITRYNRSVMYAMAVNQLADRLAELRGIR